MVLIAALQALLRQEKSRGCRRQVTTSGALSADERPSTHQLPSLCFEAEDRMVPGNTADRSLCADPTGGLGAGDPLLTRQHAADCMASGLCCTRGT
jgi:hypothetical protein